MRVVLVCHLLLGAVLMFLGLYAGVRPYALLDHLLTTEELRDPEVRDRTLMLLRRGAGKDSWMLFIAGGILTTTSAVGLVGLRKTADLPRSVIAA